TRAALLVLLGLAVSASCGAMDDESGGTLNVTVVDENGAVVPEAPVYIYGEHKTHFVGGKEVPGTTTLTVPAGDYRVSTALIRQTNGYLDRYASHEAHVQVLAGDNTVIILTLQPLPDAIAAMTLAQLREIGVSLPRSIN